MIEMLLLLLPVAATSGWYYGQRQRQSHLSQRPSKLSQDYFLGLNYLLDEQPDKAVDVFVKMLEVDTDTVETHLALGNLFRRRGEVDRAIRIHQNLIARPALSDEHRAQALLMLGQDYLKAGLLDRAERYFLNLNETGKYLIPSMQHLLDIYQQQKRWEQAAVIAEKLQKISGDTMCPLKAHYYCELALRAIENNDLEDARAHLKQAMKLDDKCVRASIILGDLEKNTGNYRLAISAYQRVIDQDEEYLSEVISPLVACYQKLGDESALQDYLEKCLKVCPRISVVLAMTEHLHKTKGIESAMDFILEQLKVRPSLRGLKHLIELNLHHTEEEKARNQLQILQRFTSDLIKTKPIYRCVQCGFHGRLLHWLCPGCKSWSTIRPVHGLEGD